MRFAGLQSAARMIHQPDALVRQRAVQVNPAETRDVLFLGGIRVSPEPGTQCFQ